MMNIKAMKKEDNTPVLTDVVFSWSIANVMNRDLYKDKVKRIPVEFSSASDYLRSFVNPLIEETHCDLRSNMMNVSHAPSCQILDVKRVIDNEHHDKLLYKLFLKSGGYKAEGGDLIALTEVRPKRIDDLDRPKRSYLIALVQSTDTEPEILILSSKPIAFEKVDMQRGKRGDTLFAVYLTNLTTNTRIWKALHPDMDGGNMNIINTVLKVNSSVGGHCTFCSLYGFVSLTLGDSRDTLDSLGLDNSQKAAVLNCITTAKCCHECSVKLVWGPPGTGKTKTIATLMFKLFRMKCRTLTCAPTNVAVMGVAKRLMGLLRGTLDYNTYGLGDIVLFGNGERMKIDDNEDLSDIFLDHRVYILSRCFSPLTGWNSSLELLICLLEDPEDQYLRYVTRFTMSSDTDEEDKSDEENELRTRCKDKHKGNTPLTIGEFFMKTFRKIGEALKHFIKGLCTHMPTSHLPVEVLNNMLIVEKILNKTLENGLDGLHNLKETRLQCLDALKLLHGMFSVPNFIDHYQIKCFCLKDASLIFCTASSSTALNVEGMAGVGLVIIDEAAQLKECESCIPLQLPDVQHAILVGDEKQLPAMVQSKICDKGAFGRSLFERLVILGHSKHLLNVQYRMHPSISLFPNNEFYGDEIKNGQNVMERAYEQFFLKGNMFGSYSFIDINNGREELDVSHSQKNVVEVAVLAEILSKLYQECTCSNQKVSVGCISPYKAQVRAIQERLGNTYSSDIDAMFSVNVRSVDGFQGAEEDVIIISTVRSNGNGSVGFLANFQRTNVALTRARYCLWILGNGATLLNSGSVWKKLVLDAKTRGRFFNAYEDKSLALAISNALVDLQQLNMLFSTDSILFKMSKWKICFAAQFKESMMKHQGSGIHEPVIALLVKLSNGWREEQLKDECLSKTEGASSQLMEVYEIKKPLNLVWTIDIVTEISKDTQIIKVWDVLAVNEIPKLANTLDNLLENYTVKQMGRCLCKRIEGNLTLPMAWPIEANARSSYGEGSSASRW